jgi:hypothetical protein
MSTIIIVALAVIVALLLAILFAVASVVIALSRLSRAIGTKPDEFEDHV